MLPLFVKSSRRPTIETVQIKNNGLLKLNLTCLNTGKLTSFKKFFLHLETVKYCFKILIVFENSFFIKFKQIFILVVRYPNVFLRKYN
jgi:hypothetical protein